MGAFVLEEINVFETAEQVNCYNIQHFDFAVIIRCERFAPEGYTTISQRNCTDSLKFELA